MPLAVEFSYPSTEKRRHLRNRVEADRYRSIFLADPAALTVFVAPFLAHLWQLRTIEGYSFGVPKNLQVFNWPKGVVSKRAITFTNMEEIPWPLLSLLNVKYVINVSREFYKNIAINGQKKSGGEELSSVSFDENPLPVVPREFFAAKVVPVNNVYEAVDKLFCSGSTEGCLLDVRKTSFSKDFPRLKKFKMSGSITSEYHGDKIFIYTDPADTERFLVLNERFHPDWHAYISGKEVKVYNTNAFMRGVIVPKGVSEVVMRFEPFMNWTSCAVFLGLAVIILFISCCLLFGLSIEYKSWMVSRQV